MYIGSAYFPLRTQHGNICTVAFLYLVGKPEDLTKYKPILGHVFYEVHKIFWEPQNFSSNVMVIKSHPFCAQLSKMIRYNLKIVHIWSNQPENIPITFWYNIVYRKILKLKIKMPVSRVNKIFTRNIIFLACDKFSREKRTSRQKSVSHCVPIDSLPMWQKNLSTDLRSDSCHMPLIFKLAAVYWADIKS